MSGSHLRSVNQVLQRILTKWLERTSGIQNVQMMMMMMTTTSYRYINVLNCVSLRREIWNIKSVYEVGISYVRGTRNSMKN
jgi:hypothetical protein